MQFTPYSQQNWVISNPSLDRLVQDYQVYSKNPAAVFDVKSSWAFVRDQPSGTETTKGSLTSTIDLNKIQPFVELLNSEQGPKE